jgi:glycosyltransferase involved in cell wall biosynthesis
VSRRLDAFAPHAVHIATEGPLGWFARGWCRRVGMPFTTSFHTRFPDYVAMRTGLPPGWIWPIVRRFHGPAARVFAATDELEAELAEKGLPRTYRWSRGVDLDLFSPKAPPLERVRHLPRPIQLYVGRIAVEKNIEAFLKSGVAGSKVVVGDGPARAELQHRYPDVRFLGALHGAELASAYASADVFVFPSRTDTFGIVILEALASGLPVAAYPVPGPLGVVAADGHGRRGRQERTIGALRERLDDAIHEALAADRRSCVAEANLYSWSSCTADFLNGLEMVIASPTAHPSPRTGRGRRASLAG